MKLNSSIRLAAVPGLAVIAMLVSLCGYASATVNSKTVGADLSLMVAVAAETPLSVVESLIAQGREALKARKPDDAIAAFDSVIALDAANARAFFYRGAARMQKQDGDGALADIEKAISIDPLYAEAFSPARRRMVD